MTSRPMSADEAARSMQVGSIATNQATRKPIVLPHRPDELVTLFFRALEWGLDENVAATRGGWPR